jgi:hypothetical protein
MMSVTTSIPLHRIAHARAGDKGNRLNVSVIAYRSEAWAVLLEKVSIERVAELFEHRGLTKIARYELPNIQALNFVMDDVLEGGVNSGLNLDTHGKSNSFLLLEMEIELPLDLVKKIAVGPQMTKT